MVRVLVVDDSAFVREFLTEVLNRSHQIEVVATAVNPYNAVEILNSKQHTIDVITLDLEMPKMDGLTFLERLMNQRPFPVVVCSSIAEQGSENAIKALELGAVEVITKPKIGLKDFFLQEEERIQEAVISASRVNMNTLRKAVRKVSSHKQEIKTPEIGSAHLLSRTTNKVIAIGASTGGTIALKEIISRLPRTSTGIIITQHMPEGFTASFAKSLNSNSQVDVKESEIGDRVLIGRAIVARGNQHLLIKRSGAYYECTHSNGPHVNRHRPAVDVMFESVARTAGKNALGILLTGMGRDGAEGLKQIQDAGGITIAQNEETCVVYGMPKAAVDIGAADYILSLDEIVRQIINFQSE